MPKGSTTKDWEMRLHHKICYASARPELRQALKGPRVPWDTEGNHSSKNPKVIFIFFLFLVGVMLSQTNMH